MATGLREKVFDRAYFHFLLIVLLGAAAYSNSLDAPFQWDDKYFIGQNPLIKQFSYFSNPSKAQNSEFYGSFKGRFIGYLSFALNYAVHGLSVRGYHAVNIAIHLLNACMLYLFVSLIFKTPYIKSSPFRLHSRGVALFSALIFVSHPVQTEAVTYVFQRLASLAAFFYLGSIVFYLKWRLKKGFEVALPLKNPSGRRPLEHFIIYLMSLLSAVLAMKTKENAFTLPLALVLMEFIFLKGSLWPRISGLFPFLITLLIIPLSLTGIDASAGEIIGSIGPLTRGYDEMSGGDYLVTQFRVIVTYIRLLFIPLRQNIDYDYPVYGSFLNPKVFLSFLFLVSVFALAVYLLLRSSSKPGLRLPAFGVFWFFLTLAVESSVIPIPMVIDEYRLYLPSAGAVLAVSSGLFIAGERFFNLRRALFALLIIVPLALAYSTHRRNNLWGNEIRLWEDTALKSPNKARPHNNLGLAYFTAGLMEDAERHYRTALVLSPGYAKAHYNLALLLKSREDFKGAIEHFEAGLRLLPDDAEAHFNLGIAYGAVGQRDRAEEHYLRAIDISQDFPEAHFNLGLLYIGKGLRAEAAEAFETVLRIDPDDDEARRFLNYARGNLQK